MRCPHECDLLREWGQVPPGHSCGTDWQDRPDLDEIHRRAVEESRRLCDLRDQAVTKWSDCHKKYCNDALEAGIINDPACP